MMSGLLAILRKARHRFADPAGAAEFQMVGVLWALGLWLLQESWIHAQMPTVARELESLIPVHQVYGIVLILLGLVTAVSSIMEQYSVLAWCYTLIVGVWCAAGWIFCLRQDGPPVVGVLSPVLAAFALVHLLQIPSRSSHAHGDD